MQRAGSLHSHACSAVDEHGTARTADSKTDLATDQDERSTVRVRRKARNALAGEHRQFRLTATDAKAIAGTAVPESVSCR